LYISNKILEEMETGYSEHLK